jgi:hypothetical protein
LCFSGVAVVLVRLLTQALCFSPLALNVRDRALVIRQFNPKMRLS